MVRGIMSIDQTACRESYGLFTPSALLQNTVNRQKTAAMENIASIVADGDRMAHIENKKASSIPEMMADANLSEPLEVGVIYIERPTMQYIPATGNNVDIMV